MATVEEIASRWLRFIPGSSRGHITAQAGEVRPGRMKVETKSTTVTVKRALTEADVVDHLRGERRIGHIPIEGDKATALHIDVDVYPMIHGEFAQKIANLDLPLIVERSKSGGAHLSLYVREPMPAARVRAVGLAMLAPLGLSQDTEVFPKQDSVADGDFGSAIWLPYFSHDRNAEYAVGADGRGITVERWLDLIERTALDAAGLEALEARLVAGISKPDDDADDDHDALPAVTADEARDRARALIARLRDAGDGQRNDTLNSVAFQIGAMVEAGLIEGDKARQTIHAAALHCGLEEAEVHGVLDRAMRDGATKGRVPTSGGWPDGVRGKKPVKTLLNIMEAIRRLGLDCRRDVFRDRNTVNGHRLNDLAGNLSDDVEIAVRTMINREFRFDPGKDVRDAIASLCVQNRFHPVCDYLDSLVWDGVPRIATMLSVYLGAENTPLNRAYAQVQMVGAVRRVRQPGSKLDTMIVLEDPKQGTGKSSAIRVLGGEFYSDQHGLLTARGKEQLELTQGVWLYEVGEMAGLAKQASSTLKAFLSQQEDTARMAYGRYTTHWSRQVVFWGTTNSEKWARDQTGNRRFFPVKTGVIDLDGLRRDRDQLWAEAAHMEAAGASTILPEELWAVAAEQQRERVLDDAWMDVLIALRGTLEGEHWRIRADSVWFALGFEEAKGRGKLEAARVHEIMASLGWVGPKTVRIGGKPMRGFERPDTPELAELPQEPEPDDDSIPF